MARSPIFSSFFWNQSFSLCVLNMVQTFSSISSPWFEKRGRGREKSAQQAANLMCNHCVNTVCLGELELFIWEDVNPTSLIWALGSGLIGSWNSREKKKGNGGGVGEPRRGKQEMKHILPWRWEVVPLSEKLFTFEGQTLSSYSGVKLASEVSLACLCAFTNVLAAQQIQYGNLLGKQKRKLYFRKFT